MPTTKTGKCTCKKTKVKKNANGVSLKLPTAICSKYFKGMNAEQMASLVEKALEAWFSGKEGADVQ